MLHATEISCNGIKYERNRYIHVSKYGLQKKNSVWHMEMFIYYDTVVLYTFGFFNFIICNIQKLMEPR
jgi:hypothetical protein